jgi:DNA mismatch repair ATPase MutS
VASTFEAEIEFAKSVLASKALPHFVMMDEIFHSTNATDGVAASQVFLKQLYKQKNVVSIISTHYRELTDMFTKETQQLQLIADEDKNGKLLYSYMIGPGVSTKSSVMEILAERGLLVNSTPGNEHCV